MRLVTNAAGTASSVRPDGQAAAAQAHQQDLLGDLLDLNDPEPAPTGAAPPPAGGNNGMQDLLGDAQATAVSMCLRLCCCCLVLPCTPCCIQIAVRYSQQWYR